MDQQRRTYTLEQANDLIPQVRAILLQLAVEQRRLDTAHADLHRQLDSNGDPSAAARADREESQVVRIREGMRSLLDHLATLGVELRDLEMGLLDIPGERDGGPVWLCWRLSDPSVAFWHATDEGFANRRPW